MRSLPQDAEVHSTIRKAQVFLVSDSVTLLLLHAPCPLTYMNYREPTLPSSSCTNITPASWDLQFYISMKSFHLAQRPNVVIPNQATLISECISYNSTGAQHLWTLTHPPFHCIFSILTAIDETPAIFRSVLTLVPLCPLMDRRFPITMSIVIYAFPYQFPWSACGRDWAEYHISIAVHERWEDLPGHWVIRYAANALTIYYYVYPSCWRHSSDSEEERPWAI